MNNYKNAGIVAGTTPTLVCTCTPPQKAIVIHSLFLTNLDDINDIRINITVHKSIGNKTVYISKNIKVPVGSTLIIDKVINLEPNDYVAVFASAANVTDVFASYLEVL
jgi:hypothetical protein